MGKCRTGPRCLTPPPYWRSGPRSDRNKPSGSFAYFFVVAFLSIFILAIMNGKMQNGTPVPYATAVLEIRAAFRSKQALRVFRLFFRGGFPLHFYPRHHEWENAERDPGALRHRRIGDPGRVQIETSPPGLSLIFSWWLSSPFLSSPS